MLERRQIKGPIYTQNKEKDVRRCYRYDNYKPIKFGNKKVNCNKDGIEVGSCPVRQTEWLVRQSNGVNNVILKETSLSKIDSD